MTVVAMSRELGTRSDEVASEFARLLGLSIDRHEGVLCSTPGLPGDRCEYFRLSAAGASRQQSNTWSAKDVLVPQDVLEMAQRESIIIFGWQAIRILHGLSNVLAVRICAPIEARVSTLMARDGTDDTVARQRIRQERPRVGRKLRRILYGRADDPIDFDLVLNTHRLGPTDCAQLIVFAAEACVRSGTHGRIALEDRLMRERIKTALSEDLLLAGNRQFVDVAVESGKVRLFGAVRNKAGRLRAEQLAASKADIGRIINDIVVIDGCRE